MTNRKLKCGLCFSVSFQVSLFSQTICTQPVVLARNVSAPVLQQCSPIFLGAGWGSTSEILSKCHRDCHTVDGCNCECLFTLEANVNHKITTISTSPVCKHNGQQLLLFPPFLHSETSRRWGETAAGLQLPHPHLHAPRRWSFWKRDSRRIIILLKNQEEGDLGRHQGMSLPCPFTHPSTKSSIHRLSFKAMETSSRQ